MNSHTEIDNFSSSAEIAKIEVITIGGTVGDDITGSMHLLVLTLKGIKEKIGYIIDAGTFQGSLSEQNNIFPEIIHNLNIKIQGILLTHPHADHIGRLAKMHKMLTEIQWWPVPIYASKATIQMVVPILNSFSQIPNENPLTRWNHTVSIEDAFDKYVNHIITGKKRRTSMGRKWHKPRWDKKRENNIEMNNDLKDIVSEINKLWGDVIQWKLVLTHAKKWNKKVINQLNSLFASYKNREKKSKIPFITGDRNDEARYYEFEMALYLEFANDEKKVENLRHYLDEIPDTNKKMEKWKIKFFQELEIARKEYKNEFLPHVNEWDIRKMMGQMRSCDIRKTIEIPHGTLTPVHTAHTLWSLGYRLQFDVAEKVFKILFPGDVGRSTNNPYWEPDLTVKEWGKDNVIFMECTASHIHAEYEKEIGKMVIFLEKMLAEGKDIIVPTFSFERMQVYMLAILKLKKENRLPDFDYCYRNKLGQELMPVYIRNMPEMKEAFELFRLFENKEYEEAENPKKEKRKPRLIIWSGWCMQEWSSAWNLRRCFPSAALLFIGYQVASPGKEFLEEIAKNKKAILGGIEYGEDYVHYCRALSWHADQEEIWDHLEELTSWDNPCTVIAVHWQHNPSHNWREILGDNVKIKVPEQWEIIKIA